MPPGEYTVEVSAISKTGEERLTSLAVTLDPPRSVPLTATQPPVILLNGWQASPTSSCPLSASSSDTFGELQTHLLSDHVPVVYFFDNCLEDPNSGSIEGLGQTLGQVLNLIKYENGALVPQVDLVSHSMGGLIVRAYLAGLQASGLMAPPPNPRVRKFVEIAAPNFGSFVAPKLGIQASEMKPGSLFLWSLATWNQGQDDLRGVDALAIIGNAGTFLTTANASDGVVSLTSGSLGFALPDQRTRIVPYCHSTPSFLSGLVMTCSSHRGIADIDSPSHLSDQIVRSFLAGTTAWQSVGYAPSADPFLSRYGGAMLALKGTNDVYFTDISAVTFDSAAGALGTGPSNSLASLFYSEYILSGQHSFSMTRSNGQVTTGTGTPVAGSSRPLLFKFGPVIGSVQSTASGLPGRTVASGANITIVGVGFSGAGTQLTANGAALPIAGLSDGQITAFLPGNYNGLIQLKVSNVSGQHTVNIMTSLPAPSTTSFTIQTNPSGLQFSFDGGALRQAPQTLTVAANSSHTIAVAQTQPGGAGTQYVFTGWNDGGAASHSITVGTLGLTYAATFKTRYQLTVAASPPGGGTVLPGSATFYDAGSVVPLTAVPSTGYTFSGWTGGVASSNALSTTVTMGSPQTVTANFTPIGPTINTGGIVPLYSSTPIIQPGSWISIYGSKFVSGITTWNGDFPVSLGGVSVTINNKPGYLWLVSPGQINMQAPDDTATGPVSVVVRTPTGTATSTVTLAPLGPSFCLLSSKYPSAVILTPDGTGAYGGGTYDLLGPLKQFTFATRPVKVGESLILYGVGFGPTIPAVPSGRSFSGAARTVDSVTVTIGGVRADVQFSGITTTGLYQFNVIVPTVGRGEQPLQATIAGVQTPSNVFVAVQ